MEELAAKAAAEEAAEAEVLAAKKAAEEAAAQEAAAEEAAEEAHRLQAEAKAPQATDGDAAPAEADSRDVRDVSAPPQPAPGAKTRPHAPAQPRQRSAGFEPEVGGQPAWVICRCPGAHWLQLLLPIQTSLLQLIFHRGLLHCFRAFQLSLHLY